MPHLSVSFSLQEATEVASFALVFSVFIISVFLFSYLLNFFFFFFFKYYIFVMVR